MHDLAIVGGGHAGLLLALAAERAGFDTAVVDPAPLDGLQPPDGRCIALLAGSRQAIEGMGVWHALEGAGVSVRTMAVTELPSHGRVLYQADDLDGRDFAYGFETAGLRNCLAAAVAANPRIRRCRTAFAGYERRREGVEVRTTQGEPIAARLLIGADGRNSAVRRAARIGVTSSVYGQAALCFTIQHEAPHHAQGHEWLRPEGPLALLPVGDDRSGVTWVENPPKARRLGDLPEADLLDELCAVIGDTLGDRLRLTTPRAVFPLGVQHARRYAAPRLALVGDAAHGVHPIHAQGFNMGVGDVEALIAVLADARRRGRELGAPDTVKGYERARYNANLGRVWMTDGLVRVFTGPPPLRLAGRAALRLIGAVPPLKRRAIAHGMQLR